MSLTKNTILYNLAFIILGNFLAVFVAILLNEMRSKWFKKVSQTIMFLPYFISQVLVGILVFNLLNYDTGFVNGILTNLGLERWQPYSDPNVWPPIMIIVYLWQQTGYNSVVYFAAIMGIDGEMMEAAKVDGAIPEDPLHNPAKLEADDRDPAPVRTRRYREGQLRIVLQYRRHEPDPLQHDGYH